jgi:uncharacterized surface protein with fasciclin (FAS1) repeats
MKSPKLLFLCVVMIAVSVIPGLVMAKDHPTNEHPGSQEHPSSAEHPGKAIIEGDNVLAKAAADGRFTQFIAAVEAAGLTDNFQMEGPFTIFAPTDEAFANLPEGKLAELLAPANKSRLAGLIANHVLAGKLEAESVKTMKTSNINMVPLDIQVSDSEWTVDGAQVVGDEIQAGNGVIHVIDTVLFVPEPSEHPEHPEHPENSKPKDHPGH